jgi:hypothetical protein
MAQVNIDANNAYKLLDKKAYTRSLTTANTVFGFSSLLSKANKIPYKTNVYLGVITDFKNVGGRIWSKIKLQYPVSFIQKSGSWFGGSSSNESQYGELWFAIDTLTADDTLQPNLTNAAGVVISSDVWCKGTNVSLREKPDRTSKVLNVFSAPDYLGKSDGVKLKGGTYAGGSDWYKITLPDTRTAYMAAPYVLFRKPATGKPNTGSPQTATPEELKDTEIPTLASPAERTLTIVKYVAVAAGAGWLLWRISRWLKTQK